MNLLITFLFFILAIVVFLILYYVNYNKFILLNKHKLKENFQCEGSSNIFNLIEDNEVQICYNNITPNSNIITFSNSMLYLFDGESSYAYVRDFLDNYLNIEFNCKIQSPIEEQTTTTTGVGSRQVENNNQENNIRTLLESKFVKITIEPDSLNYIQLKATYKPTQETKILIRNIDLNSTYFFKLLQEKEFRQVTVKFGTDALNLTSETFDVAPSQACDYSSGNHVYIGCSSNLSDFIKAHIGNISLEIDKEKYDSYFFNDLSIPTDLSCGVETVSQTQPIDNTIVTQNVTEQLIESDFSESTYTNYIEIVADKVFTDLKVQYFSNEFEDYLSRLSSQRSSEVDNFYSNLTITNSVFTNKQIMFLEESNIFFDGYNNFMDDTKDYICYCFNVNNQRNAEYLSKFNFLNLDKLRNNYRNYTENYIFIYGERAENTSFFKFLKIKKPIFISIHKGRQSVYNYEPIQINLQLFYEFQKKYIIFMITEGIDQNKNNNTTFSNFMNTQKVFRSILDDNVTNNSNNTYISNIYRLYESRIDIDFSVNIYKDLILNDTILLKYKTIELEGECTFNPNGNTIFECIGDCNKSDNQYCDNETCESVCRNCKTEACKWNAARIEQVNKLVPSSINVKGFAGNKSVKLSWIKPSSNYKITNYFILMETINSSLNNNFDVYIFNSSLELNEYTITNLINNNMYSFYVIAQNQVGMSDISNKVSVIPSESKQLDINQATQNQNSFSDSIQNMQQRSIDELDGLTPNEARERINHAERLIQINELKDMLVNKVLESKIKNSKVNINIF